MLAFCALEAHTNAIADEFSARPELTVHERAVLLEQEVRLDKGEFKTGGLKIYRLEENSISPSTLLISSPGSNRNLVG